ncbi:hypothetical protein OHB24_21985 [Kribbella sp. NBC_00482]|uniref:hypothetical protein n=1 Tax=Kribbella sp. NBC_00482 TaxID=2975968 RepID=UPI002E19ACD9
MAESRPSAQPATDLVDNLIKDRKLTEARKVADSLTSNEGTRQIGLLSLARIAQQEKAFGDALLYVEQAFDLNHDDVQTAAKYLDLLFWVGNYRLALSVYSSLRDIIRDDPRIQAEIHYIYSAMGWSAHARRADANVPRNHADKPTDSRPVQIRDAALRATVDRLRLKLESKEAEGFALQIEDLWIVDQLVFRNRAQTYRTSAELDASALSYTSMVVRRQVWILLLRWAYLGISVSAIILGTLLLTEGIHPLLRISVGGATAAAVVASVSAIYRYGKSYFPQELFASLLGFGAIVGGVAGLRFLSPDNEWFRILALGVGAGGVLAATAGIAEFASRLYFRIWFQRHRRQYARANVIGALATLLVEMRSIEKQNDPVERGSWIRGLEYVAGLLEQEVPRQAAHEDPSVQDWLSEWLAGVAESTRHMKRSIVAPAGRSWERMARTLHHQLSAIATENWCAAKYQIPRTKLALSWKDRARAVGKFVIVTALPGIGYIVIAPVFGDSNSIQRGALLSLAWGLISALLILDPAAKEKTAIMRDLSGAWGQAPERKPENTGADNPAGRPTIL